MAKPRSRVRVAARVLAATLGAYAVTAGAAALIAVLLAALAHLSRSDALVLGSVLAYILYVFLILWCFAERRLARVWIVLIFSATASHGLAIWIEYGLPVIGATS